MTAVNRATKTRFHTTKQNIKLVMRLQLPSSIAHSTTRCPGLTSTLVKQERDDKIVPGEQKKAEYAQVISLIARFDTLQKLGLASNFEKAPVRLSVTVLNRYQRT